MWILGRRVRIYKADENRLGVITRDRIQPFVIFFYFDIFCIRTLSLICYPLIKSVLQRSAIVTRLLIIT